MTVRIDQPGPIRKGEELSVPRLQKYLLANLPNSDGPLVIEQFPCGHSNLTYRLQLGPHELVLRRPPFGNPVKSAHDMGREYRVLKKLCEVYEPAPRPFLYCQDHDVIGDEFYVMERRTGVVLRDPVIAAPLRATAGAVRGLCEAFVDNLARLHTLDYRSAGLGDVGKPAGYVERQVTGWIKRYEAAKTDSFPEVEQLGRWLAEHRPPDSRPALIHNDYKYDNVLLDPHDLTKIIAVFDWEMATLGDPLMDLGMTLAYWIEATDCEQLRQAAFGPTMLPGSFTRRELLARYVEKTGFEAPNSLFYFCFGLYKLAVIVQQIYARFVRGLTQDVRFAEMNLRVESLGQAGVHAIEVGEI